MVLKNDLKGDSMSFTSEYSHQSFAGGLLIPAEYRFEIVVESFGPAASWISAVSEHQFDDKDGSEGQTSMSVGWVRASVRTMRTFFARPSFKNGVRFGLGSREVWTDLGIGVYWRLGFGDVVFERCNGLTVRGSLLVSPLPSLGAIPGRD